MFVGTGSDVGKSVVNAGFCRIFKQDGYQPAPFKGQNMSLNSYATPEGFEIGRAQAVQAEACGVPCHTDMNPVLLKPTNYTSAQVVLNGKPIGNQSAMDYFSGNGKDYLFEEVKKAFDTLEERYSPIVMEGAGSISEINLRDRDITNMRMAIHAKASTYLVADIDRGGVFASVYGTIMLLTPEERERIKGIVINKFRGDIRLFENGVKQIEELTGIPVVGVIPYFSDIYIEEEDSVMLETKQVQAMEGKVNIAVVLLKRMSNFTDFNILERDERCHLFYTNNIDEIKKADIVLIPGSKNTIADLMEIRSNGVAKAIIEAHKQGKTVVGICGGYQMMGQQLTDPHHIEGDIEAVPGLGLLPTITEMSESKTTEQCNFKFRGFDENCQGYEIHMGETHLAEGESNAVNILDNGKQDGYYIDEKCWGSYIHGILDNPVVIGSILEPYLDEKETSTFNLQEFKETQYDALADHIRKHVDMEKIYAELLIENA